MIRRIIFAALLSAGLAVCGWAQTAAPGMTQRPKESAPEAQSVATQQAAAAMPAPNDYGKAENWLCRPGRNDACAVDLTTTVIAADGKLTREDFSADANAAIDCFYIYPTVSNEPTANSDMVIHDEERHVIAVQFARFASVCRPFAPMYRQTTLTALRAAFTGTPMKADRTLAFDDVLDAWKYYLAHDNQGRGAVLIGHSQGANILGHLIKDEIDGKDVQKRVVSAILIGANIAVPPGKMVGGDFKKMPLCRAAREIGCVIAYVSFRATAPPPENSLFGKVKEPGVVAGCANPAALGGGSGELHAYFTAKGSLVANAAEEPRPWVEPPQTIETPFVSLPGMLTAECVADHDANYLAVTVHGDPDSPRASDIPGDIVVRGTVWADWGLHLIDVQLAMGNLIEVVREEAKSYGAKKK